VFVLWKDQITNRFEQQALLIETHEVPPQLRLRTSADHTFPHTLGD